MSYREVSALTKQLDDRPITFAMSESVHSDRAVSTCIMTERVL